MDISKIYDLFLGAGHGSGRISTDTRHLPQGCLFFALKGDHFDGNQFAAQALEKGAAYAVVDDPAVATSDRVILVDNVLEALQELARVHRKTFSFPVIALTGSNGKTTTKELITCVLSARYRTVSTKGNLNNHIGVPLTILSVDTDTTDMLVVEMGANHEKEIALLCTIAQPTHGLITNIGKAHLEGFGSLDGVKRAKGELYDYLSKKKGTIFVNAANETLMELVSKRRAFGDIVFYNSESTAPNPIMIGQTPFVTYSIGDLVVSTHLVGEYNFNNICAALRIGAYFEVPEDQAHRAISDYTPDNNRSQIVQRNTNTILLDAYNANPSSMAAALENFSKMDAERKMVILGDMLELGNESKSEHELLGDLIARGAFDVVLLFGKEIAHALRSLPKAYYFPDKFSLHNWIMDNPQQHTHVLVKGSRGMGLESVVNFL
ncbi:UDP-N-acetylmuramoyl-tripeptide--D-alanyl-D-alanine ligase [Ravibacter arvi]|uniref:UDP-N-acetylmuramoyl-tripeptide--D-alanyl-D-alanine ligase n=1 Tax=Ravibacter arvi TaxID=2051041 RepID=A0ABP8LLV2_9BACT